MPVLYHGTSASRAANIMKNGIIPDIGKGVSEFAGLSKENKGLTFLTPKESSALKYARQQAVLEKINANPNFLERLIRAKLHQTLKNKKYKEIFNSIPKKEQNQVFKALKTKPGQWMGLQNSIFDVNISPKKYSIIKANIPESVYKKKLIENPEIKAGKSPLSAFITDPAFKGEINKKYLSLIKSKKLNLTPKQKAAINLGLI